MELKYLLLILGIASITKINAYQTVFENLQVVDYDAKNALYFGEIDLHGFQNIGNKYYLIESTTKMTWWDAYFTCRTLNSSLATIETVKELENLSPYLMEFNSEGWYWVGGTDMYKEGEWKWMDTGKNISRGDLWTATQPDNGGSNELCAMSMLWRMGEPNMFRLNDWTANEQNNAGSNENCAFLWRDGDTNMFRLNDWMCNYATYFICEHEAPKAVSFVNWCLP